MKAPTSGSGKAVVANTHVRTAALLLAGAIFGIAVSTLSGGIVGSSCVVSTERFGAPPDEVARVEDRLMSGSSEDDAPAGDQAAADRAAAREQVREERRAALNARREEAEKAGYDTTKSPEEDKKARDRKRRDRMGGSASSSSSSSRGGSGASANEERAKERARRMSASEEAGKRGGAASSVAGDAPDELELYTRGALPGFSCLKIAGKKVTAKPSGDAAVFKPVESRIRKAARLLPGDAVLDFELKTPDISAAVDGVRGGDAFFRSRIKLTQAVSGIWVKPLSAVLLDSKGRGIVADAGHQPKILRRGRSSESRLHIADNAISQTANWDAMRKLRIYLSVEGPKGVADISVAAQDTELCWPDGVDDE